VCTILVYTTHGAVIINVVVVSAHHKYFYIGDGSLGRGRVWLSAMWYNAYTKVVATLCRVLLAF
jgi:hypothetical protein